ncbi:MAG: permease-like cell division protein FtsX, partial [Clostridia bacterium]|nr:permease-like cell division protein FtsX [Clostridia bacterium]
MSKNFLRILKFALQDLNRNKGISIATIFVLLVAMMLVSSTFFLQGMMSYLTSEIQNKIDITAYFKEDASEEDIMAVKVAILSSSPEVKSIEYISKDQALLIFNEKHGDNAVLARALEQVGDNPFLPSLNIVTNGEAVQYEQVSNTLQTSDYAKLIEKVDYSEKKDTIEKVYSITSNINKFGIIAGIILIFVAILVVFNTIKLAVDSSRAEISTMRIVGASDWFIRGPFIIQGVIYGVVAFLICIFLMAIFCFIAGGKIAVILPGFNA